jgi:hypothetical protein
MLATGDRKEPHVEDKKPLDATLVQEFVGNAHGNMARVRELLEQEPALVNACWDWGEGDWETGLGAASHMGNRPIAEFLLSKGARMDIFAAAMLGRVEIVQAMLDAFPSMAAAPGPHGIPLIAHAKAGSDEAAQVLQLLSKEVAVG